MICWRHDILDTDFLQAQSEPYRRMSANLYETKIPGEYYHIHGSLEASRTLNMIGLEGYRPDLRKHNDIVAVIEPAVQKFTIEELEALNAENKQAGVPAYRYKDFLRMPHVGPSIFPIWLSCQGLGRRTSSNCRCRVYRTRTNLHGLSLQLNRIRHKHPWILPLNRKVPPESWKASKSSNYAV